MSRPVAVVAGPALGFLENPVGMVLMRESAMQHSTQCRALDGHGPAARCCPCAQPALA